MWGRSRKERGEEVEGEGEGGGWEEGGDGGRDVK